MRDHQENFAFRATIKYFQSRTPASRRTLDYSNLREEESGERNVHKDTLIHRLPENSTNEPIPAEAMN